MNLDRMALKVAARLVDSIRPGDIVTIISPHGQKLTGRAVMPAKGGIGWVLNLGGRHGTPGIATDENTIMVRKSQDRKSKPVDDRSPFWSSDMSKVGERLAAKAIARHGIHVDAEDDRGG